MAQTLQTRLKKNSTVNEAGCWVWNKSLNAGGYGQTSIGSRTDGSRRTAIAHRVSYREFVGLIPAGLTLDHLCKNRACINPKHLEPVTIAENIRRGNPFWKQEARQTHCKRGHEFTSENTAYRQNKWGTVSRHCKSCSRANTIRRYRLTHPEVQTGKPLWAQNSAKTHCVNGHEFIDANTYHYGNRRKCKTCNREYNRRNWTKFYKLRKARGVA